MGRSQKELTRIAYFIDKEFSHLVSPGLSTADIAIEVMKAGKEVAKLKDELIQGRADTAKLDMLEKLFGPSVKLKRSLFGRKPRLVKVRKTAKSLNIRELVELEQNKAVVKRLKDKSWVKVTKRKKPDTPTDIKLPPNNPNIHLERKDSEQ